MARSPHRKRSPAERRRQDTWEHRLGELLEFRRVHGHVNVPRHWPDNPRLGTWVGNQRRLLRLRRLGAGRLRRLADLGISWGGLHERREAQRSAWERMFEILRGFREEHGHLVMPRRWARERQLAPWLATQRFLHRTGALLEERRRLLDELDRDWHRRPPVEPSRAAPRRESREESFRLRAAALERYRRQHGHASVPTRWKDDPKLARWVANQRSLRKRGALSRSRIEQLDRMGFDWSGVPQRNAQRDRRWEERASALEAFRLEHGHADVPLGWGPDRALGVWVFRQRREQRRGSLRADRKSRLDALGFSWTPTRPSEGEGTRAWEARFSELAAFVKRYRHADVADEVPHRALFRWLEGQRRRQRTGKLDARLTRRMESIGVLWQPREAKWEARYRELSEYRRQHGDCAIEMSGRENPGLSRWVSSQRAARRAGTLGADRQKRLDAIGFLWEAPKGRRS